MIIIVNNNKNNKNLTRFVSLWLVEHNYLCKIGFLKTVGTSGKNVYITYKHSLLQNFIDILNEDETIAMNEINNLIAVKNGMPGVTGLLILDFEVRNK